MENSSRYVVSMPTGSPLPTLCLQLCLACGKCIEARSLRIWFNPMTSAKSVRHVRCRVLEKEAS